MCMYLLNPNLTLLFTLTMQHRVPDGWNAFARSCSKFLLARETDFHALMQRKVVVFIALYSVPNIQKCTESIPFFFPSVINCFCIVFLLDFMPFDILPLLIFMSYMFSSFIVCFYHMFLPLILCCISFPFLMLYFPVV